jgi:hypothetical protein
MKNVGLWFGIFLFASVSAVAQVASGNVADSANPRSDMIDAQNFVQRTVEGCVVQQGSNFLLVPKHGRPVELTSKPGENVSQNVGHQVKVSGRESYAGEGASVDADYILAAERLVLIAQPCPANWNDKWTGQSSSKP